MKGRIALDWSDNAACNLQFDDGVTIFATLEGKAVGLLSVYWRELSELSGFGTEGHIDINEVGKEYRRLGIARYSLISAAERASKRAHSNFGLGVPTTRSRHFHYDARWISTSLPMSLFMEVRSCMDITPP